MREKRAIYINGYAGIVGLVVLALVGLFFFYLGMWQAKVWALFLSIFLWLIALLLLSSATVVSPNQAKVILFFGQYLGTIRENGFFLTIPLAQKMTVSLKVRNFNSSVLKVNDLDGNPIEISAVVVFKVIDTAKALFDLLQSHLSDRDSSFNNGLSSRQNSSCLLTLQHGAGDFCCIG